ncbi:major facilitator superfamily domain-containing protein [Aspergillus foveolatus]|uniref:major facilitator superfamily domain-containing protein n=1 Tax=Aspergillus foveolatus TaxID=210207 RepID=UPI003CCCA725
MFIVIIAGFATITSPLTATVYFPLLPTLEGQFRVSPQTINMTLTIYIIFQAISPAIFGPLSDTVGRRPIFLLTLAIYALANLGMALNKHNYGFLLLLRALQSLGASAAFAISYGIVADVCVSSERGKTMAWVSIALNLGTCLGPVIGGLVAYLSGNIEWVFWALFIVGLLLFLIVGMFLPETARNLVGNGNAFWCLWINGSFYAVDYILAATVPNIFTDIYQFNTLLTGLAYLPRGIGIIVGSYCNGRMMDHNYKVTARKHNQPINRVFGDNLQQFPIELARSRGTYYLLVISTCTLLAYGWTANYKKQFTILLILQFIQGFWGTCFYTIYNTLLIDVFPDNPSTAAASASITRCALAAIGVTTLQPFVDAAGLGWYFTALGLFSAVCGVVAVRCVRKYGMRWRQQRYMNT